MPSKSRCRAQVKDACPFHGNSFHLDAAHEHDRLRKVVAAFNPANESRYNDRLYQYSVGKVNAISQAVITQQASMENQPQPHGGDAYHKLSAGVSLALTDFDGINTFYAQRIGDVERDFNFRKQALAYGAEGNNEGEQIAQLTRYVEQRIGGLKMGIQHTRDELSRHHTHAGATWDDKLTQQDLLAQEAIVTRLEGIRTRLLRSTSKTKAQQRADNVRAFFGANPPRGTVVPADDIDTFFKTNPAPTEDHTFTW